MVAETSEASKDQQSESATGENKRARAHACVTKSGATEHLHVHMQNLQFDQCRKSNFSTWEMSCSVIKAMDNV